MGNFKQLEVPDNVAVNFFKSELNGIESGQVYMARCPVCGDSHTNKHRKRMYLLKKNNNWMVYCHNCAYSASLLRFVKEFFPTRYDSMVNNSVNDFFKPKSREDKLDDLIDGLSERIKSRTRKKNVKLMKYIKNSCVPLTKDCGNEDVQEEVTGQILQLKERRLSDEFISSLYYAVKGDYKYRVIIPFYDKDGDIFYFQAKGTKKWQVKNKYINWEDEDIKNKPLYNELFVDKTSTVYVIEGLIDSLFTKNGISVTGASLSMGKVREIKKQFDNVVWVMDNDITGLLRTKKLFGKGETCVLFPKEFRKIKDMNDLAILLKKDDLTEILKKNSYNSIVGLIELTGRL